MNNDNMQQPPTGQWRHFERERNHGRFWTGFFLILIGAVLLLKTARFLDFPGWVFSWPMILIVVGLFNGVRHGFKGSFWLLLLLVGGLFLANEINRDWGLTPYIGPIAIIAAGLLFITRPKRKHFKKWEHIEGYPSATPAATAAPAETIRTDERDFINITSVFSGTKKNVLSKNVQGGDLVSFMGGSEVDLSQADINGTVQINITNLFGGTKLIVPPTWDVQNDLTAIFGGVDDKRLLSGVTMDHKKVLVLQGVCMFGGVEIRSY